LIGGSVLDHLATFDFTSQKTLPIVYRPRPCHRSVLVRWPPVNFPSSPPSSCNGCPTLSLHHPFALLIGRQSSMSCHNWCTLYGSSTSERVQSGRSDDELPWRMARAVRLHSPVDDMCRQVVCAQRMPPMRRFQGRPILS